MYLKKTRPLSSYSNYAAVEYINSFLPESARVLVLGDSAGFRLKRDYIISSVFDRNPAVEWAMLSADAEELRKRMTEAGVTHVMINYGEAARNSAYRIFYWDERGAAVFADFTSKYLKEVFSHTEKRGDSPVNRVAVYEISAG